MGLWFGVVVLTALAGRPCCAAGRAPRGPSRRRRPAAATRGNGQGRCGWFVRSSHVVVEAAPGQQVHGRLPQACGHHGVLPTTGLLPPRSRPATPLAWPGRPAGSSRRGAAHGAGGPRGAHMRSRSGTPRTPGARRQGRRSPVAWATRRAYQRADRPHGQRACQSTHSAGRTVRGLSTSSAAARSSVPRAIIASSKGDRAVGTQAPYPRHQQRDIRHRTVAYASTAGRCARANSAVIDLRDPGQRAALDDARRRLDALPRVRIDPAHRYSFRARSAGGPLPASDPLPASGPLPAGVRAEGGPGGAPSFWMRCTKRSWVARVGVLYGVMTCIAEGQGDDGPGSPSPPTSTTTSRSTGWPRTARPTWSGRPWRITVCWSALARTRF